MLWTLNPEIRVRILVEPISLRKKPGELSSATQTMKPNTVIAMEQINHNHFYFGHGCMTQESRKSSLDHFLIELLGIVIQSGVQSEVTFKSFKSYPNQMSKMTDEHGSCGWWLLIGRSINVTPLE